MNTYLCSFSHPNEWKDIFEEIVNKFGEDLKNLQGGIGFEDECQTLVFTFLGGQEKRVRLHNIDVIPPCVAGGWFTFLRNKGVQLHPVPKLY